MLKTCPQCKQFSQHEFTGNQELPARNMFGKAYKDDNGRVVMKTVKLYTCKKCGSTWVKK